MGLAATAHIRPGALSAACAGIADDGQAGIFMQVAKPITASISPYLASSWTRVVAVQRGVLVISLNLVCSAEMV
jgi:predicted short-subunit dehydrogenase-like oxidoreductase (DUF2520 family)